MTDSTRQGESRPSIGELVSNLSENLSTLIRDEIRLAKSEMAAKAKAAGIGLALFAAAGVLAFWATGVLIAAVILGIAEGLAAWLAALIVAVVLFALIAVLGILGKKSMERSSPPVPEAAQASVKADVDAIKAGLASKEEEL